MKNQSKKTEKLEPQDSGQKNLNHPQDDENAVIKPEDKAYNQEEADFDNPAGKREKGEQPVHPVKEEPKE